MKIDLLAIAFFATTVLAVSPAQARNYDCSKGGNANKAVCRGKVMPLPATAAASKAAPVMATKSAERRHYDCTKGGNVNKAACKNPLGAGSASPIVGTKPHWWSKSAATAPIPLHTMQSAPPAVAADAAGPQGATAKCKDGSFSHSMHHSGSCSHHGGVDQFY